MNEEQLVVRTTPEHLERRRRAMGQYEDACKGLDDLDPTCPAGHAYSVQKSAWLTQTYRSLHRKLAMKIGPQEVIDVLVAGGVKNWVLSLAGPDRPRIIAGGPLPRSCRPRT